MNSNTEIKPSAAEPAETSEQQKFRMSPVMTEAYTQMLAAADEVEKVVVGKRTEVVLLLTALLAGAHVLIEDVPGTGKTTLAAALATVTGLDFRRAQFTPDVMASDITGFNIYNRQRETLRGWSCATCCSRTRSTALLPKRNRHCWRRWRKERSR